MIIYTFCNSSSSQCQRKINIKHLYGNISIEVLVSLLKELLMKQNEKNCAAVIKCTGGSTSGLLRHLRRRQISSLYFFANFSQTTKCSKKLYAIQEIFINICVHSKLHCVM